ncbi:MAG TPA: PIG-L family deacetylase [Vicinamibacterales bacterium]|nr:PIG-L family deacetylase [Vicinamibacterales bacterium]
MCKPTGLIAAIAIVGVCGSGIPSSAQEPKLRIIAFGAHPDDNELRLAGTAAKWAALGHHVKFVSVTNGDIGHWREAGGPLARRRTQEVQQAAKLLGITTQVLDLHDGELEPTLENRRTITRLIRDWKADIVLGHRPEDYHPDHRAVGVLVRDASYMVTVPFFCPDTPHLERNPVFLSYEDRFTQPAPLRADIVVAIDDVVEKKLAAVEAMPSQFYEGGANGGPALVPDDEPGKARRKTEVREGFKRRFAGTAQRFRDKLRELYGAKPGDAVQYAEAFEISEYGRRPTAEEIRRLFPFFGKP